MSSRLSHRLAVSTLVLAVLLALAAPPAQAATSASVLDNLGAKVQTWLAAWLPGASPHNEGLAEPNGGTKVGSHGQLPSRQVSGGGAHHPVIRPQCSGYPGGDPNGCPP